MSADNTQEVWRPVVGWEGWYEVSSFGQVKRVAAGQGARAGHVLSQSTTKKGYRQVSLYDGPRKQPRRVHKLVAEAFIGPVPDGMQINHIDTNRTNNRLDNLEYVTPLGNSQHMISMGNSLRGERHPHARLTEDDVRAIRVAREGGAELSEISARYGVSAQAVCDMTKGRTWKHVE